MGSRIDIMVQFIHLRITIWFLRAAGDDLNSTAFSVLSSHLDCQFYRNHNPFSPPAYHELHLNRHMNSEQIMLQFKLASHPRYSTTHDIISKLQSKGKKTH